MPTSAAVVCEDLSGSAVCDLPPRPDIETATTWQG